MGPWNNLYNRVSTLPKLHKSPQIPNFLSLLYGKIKGDQRVKDYLVVCHLVETLGMLTLIIRVDLFMDNNPLELKTFVQIYNLNDHVDFGDSDSESVAIFYNESKKHIIFDGIKLIVLSLYYLVMKIPKFQVIPL